MTKETPYPKRLIEVDLPIKRISAHARREKSIRRGHISTLHIWWARRPLASCRAVICASLWPDPTDPNCPTAFREAALKQMTAFAKATQSNKELSNICDADSWKRYKLLADGTLIDFAKPKDLAKLQQYLLDFIADFAAWEASSNHWFLDTARYLTQAAHQALGGEKGTRPLVVDPFAGGGAIPLEALRVGADAFASDLNPVPVLLNRVALEFIPRHGQKLADEVRKWGKWIREQAEKELQQFYPRAADGSMPIAYLWARTVICEGPGCGAEVPLMRSLWLAKKGKRSIALRMTPNANGRRVEFEILGNAKPKDVAEGTMRRGSATCLCCGYTTPVTSVRSQLSTRHGGANDARLYAVAATRGTEVGRFYRLPDDSDLAAFGAAAAELSKRERSSNESLSLVPNEAIPPTELRRISIPIYGMRTWGSVFTSRQALTLTTLARLIRNLNASGDDGLNKAVKTVLALAMDKQADRDCSLCRWISQNENVGYTFGRQAIGMLWDFVESPPFAAGGGWSGIIEDVAFTIEQQNVGGAVGHVEQSSATEHPLPSESVDAVVTDPPYYDAVPYAHLTDFFYPWLRRMLGDEYSGMFTSELTVKDREVVVDRPHRLSDSTHDIAYYERSLTQAFAEASRITRREGIANIVFASKTTASWEAILQAIVSSNWIITASWPLDTEREARIAALDQARLGSSVHIVCRKRIRDVVGDWREVLAELPIRIREWMARLSSEGVVGADAIFACLGPALEIFSRYSRVEKASGEPVLLKEYLTYVWGAISQEALAQIFKDADASGFEEDARLTAMWLWTLNAGTPALEQATESGDDDNESSEDDEEEESSSTGKSSGYTLEFDAARKIAQGLGAHLEELNGVVEVKGDKARLLGVAERTRSLFGKDDADAPTTKRKKKDKQMKLFSLEEVEAEEGGWGDKNVPKLGDTVLDRVHQSMILFAAGRGEALRRFLVEDGAGQDQRFWKLANALSALYPQGTDEKRWVDGVLARKKGLGL